MNPLAALDHKHVWHPFTQMRDWLKREPLVIVEGHGAVLHDVKGRKYLDANSSIWTNLHGHTHPKINRAIERQLKKVAHSSALGLANEPASLLAAKLIEMVRPSRSRIAHHTSGATRSASQSRRLTKIFYSDDGSTAMEVALKLAYEYTRRLGRSKNPKFLSLEGAYHGDTVGAVALGHIDLFHKAYSKLLFKTDKARAPYCYRCPYNRAKPERADARDYRKCNWECLDKLEQKFSNQKRKGNSYAGFVVEPLIQGAAGMIPQPAGWLKRAAEISWGHGSLLIADEVMTGFGRATKPPTLSACQQENVTPDMMAVAKGLTGGYLPMAATLITQPIFKAFLGEYRDFKTFFHGHSFTGNQLGAAAALANLEILQSPASIRARNSVDTFLQQELKSLWALPNVGDIRQVGLIAGIELVKDWRTRAPFELRQRAGIRVCEAMAKRGVLTRPIGNVVVLMPPYCTTREQLKQMVTSMKEAIVEVFI
jgi:adenosylmethionine---8-amino-7-oxononanoate aminotransferase